MNLQVLYKHINNVIGFKIEIIMNKIEEEFLDRATTLMTDIRNYILSNNDWVYYFLNPLFDTDANKPLKNIVEEYPDEWENYVNIQITDFNGSSAKICIEIDDCSECPIRLDRFIYLPHFSESVEKNKKLNEGNINEWKIANLKEEIASCKARLELKIKELKNLLNIV